MTPLSPTWPEPARDIAAQLAAYLDPDHPKRAVWVSSPICCENPITCASPSSRENPISGASPNASKNPFEGASPDDCENPAVCASPGPCANPAARASPGNGENPVSCAYLDLPAGRLYAAPRLLRRLRSEPCEEVLAEILGYLEMKSVLQVRPDVRLPVVQALDAGGWIVHEMLSSWSRVGEAKRLAQRYGAVRVVTMAACLERRQRLIAEEVSNAESDPERSQDRGCRR
jgi:hypothetical protein